MLGLGKSGEVWCAKLEKNDEVRHNITQIASLLAVATVFYWLMDSIYQSGRGGRNRGYGRMEISRRYGLELRP